MKLGQNSIPKFHQMVNERLKHKIYFKQILNDDVHFSFLVLHCFLHCFINLNKATVYYIRFQVLTVFYGSVVQPAWLPLCLQKWY
jgi:hypothetical protein